MKSLLVFILLAGIYGKAQKPRESSGGESIAFLNEVQKNRTIILLREFLAKGGEKAVDSKVTAKDKKLQALADFAFEIQMRDSNLYKNEHFKNYVELISLAISKEGNSSVFDLAGISRTWEIYSEDIEDNQSRARTIISKIILQYTKELTQGAPSNNSTLELALRKVLTNVRGISSLTGSEKETALAELDATVKTIKKDRSIFSLKSSPFSLKSQPATQILPPTRR